MRERVEKILTQLRPYMQMHRGDITLVGVEEETGTVRVRLEGACKGCPMSQLTLKAGVEATLMDQVPEVKQVIAVD